jgi:hypothetical protein
MTDTGDDAPDRTTGSSRRRVLAVAGGALAPLVAGCSGGGDGGDGSDGGGGETNSPTDDTGGTGNDADGSAGGSDPTDTDTDGAGGDGTDGGDGEAADPATVAFDRRWQETFDYQDVISSRNFGADATPDGVFLGGEWGFAGLGLADGERLWTTEEWEGFVDVRADRDVVVAYANSFEVVALEPSDGTERWRRSTTGSENAFFNTALTASYFVAGSADGVVVFDRASGEVVARIDASPRDIVATDDALVAIGSGGTAVYDTASGSERWREGPILAVDPVVDDGRLVGIQPGFGDEASSLRAIDLASGDAVWSEELGDAAVGSSPAAATDGVVTFIGGEMTGPSTLYGHALDGGSRLWSHGLGRVGNSGFAPPATDSGVVLAPAVTDENRSQVHAYGARSGDRLASTGGAIGVAEAMAVDRVFLEVELDGVTTIGF